MKSIRKIPLILLILVLTAAVPGTVCLHAETDRKGTGNEAEKKKEKEPSEDLQAWLERELKNLDGKWAVYIKDLGTGRTISLNDRKMTAASLIKLYVAGAYYEGKENGTIDWSRTGKTSSASGKQDEKETIAEYDRKADIMISCSDNDACNALIDLLGKDTINRFIKDHGFRKTELTRKMLENTGTENYTSAGECGRVLEEICNGNYVSKEASEAILKNLKAQERTSKIPAGVPENVATANKTGELAAVENDTAIIWGKKTTYILCVMSSDLKSTEEARKEIVKISSKVYSVLDGSPRLIQKKRRVMRRFFAVPFRAVMPGRSSLRSL